ncbi:MAG: hypothetical protein IKQ62_04625 [Bacteroidaceae bacterium]|nr:hypothetical protein [Bacteroidaceae bacterium]
MDKTPSPMPFSLHISVENRTATASAPDLLSRFIQQAAQQYELTVTAPPSGTTASAQATITVPFAHREHIRILFNIFAADMEEEHGTGLYFHMESAF